MKRLKIFIDTDFLIALNDKDDTLHQKAIKVLENLSQTQKKTSAFVSTNILLETLIPVSQKLGKKKALELLKELRSGKYLIIHPDENLVLKAEKIFKEIKSKNVSYSDCLSFAVMKEYRIKLVLSFDLHFKKQGFQRICLDQVAKLDNLSLQMTGQSN